MPYIMAVDLGGTNCRFAGFTLAKGQVRILRGELGRHKTVAIDAPKQIPAEIAALLDNQG